MQFALRTLIHSMQYAWRGIRYVYRNEQNFRLQIFLGCVVTLAAFFLHVSKLESVALIFVIVAVLVMEVLNTVLERFIDIVKPRLHSYAEVIKDMMAGAVMLTSLGAVIIGAIIMLPYILAILV